MQLKQHIPLLLSLLGLLLTLSGSAQHQFPMSEFSFDDLSAFQPTQQNWQIVGGVQAVLDQPKTFKTSSGKGILVNRPEGDNQAQIFTQLQHGDIDLDFEVMMPVGSNSGVYLQGRYEIQLLDSWGKRRPTFADIGGIYQRWDNSQPEGKKGYDGKAPLTNAAKAPGLWQRLQISFRAPRFDAQGKKIKNARFIYVKLNGIIIHQNVELTGPTRVAYVGNGDEAPLGPIVIQGDHGPVAFRNFKYRNFDGQPIQLKNLQYKAVQNTTEIVSDWSQVTTSLQGNDDLLTWNVAKADNEFAIHYEGQLDVPTAGDYLFELRYQGRVRLWLNDKMILDEDRYISNSLVQLPKGMTPFRLEYSKKESWQQPQLGCTVEGIDFRAVNLHYKSSNLTSRPTDPIFEQPTSQTRLLRSFVDFKMPQMEQAKKITNAINVGDPIGLHYTFDLNQGSLVQVWRGDFLNMTPMWYNRGNGVSKAQGVLIPLTPNAQLMQRQSDGTLNPQFEEGQYRYRSYKVDENNRPTFHYEAYGLQIADQLMPNADRKSIKRQLQMTGEATGDLVFCLAEGQRLTQLDGNRYLVDDQYYIETAASTKVESLQDGRQALLIPINGKQTLEYTIIW